MRPAAPSCPPARSRPATGFTLIEVIAVLLMISLGLFSVIGLFTYGLRLASRAQAANTAMATAMSVAVDDGPWVDGVTGNWTRTATYDLDDLNGSSVAKGMVNGYFVERTETAAQSDILSQNLGRVGARSVRVDIDVFDAIGGEKLASFTTRLVRTRNVP